MKTNKNENLYINYLVSGKGQVALVFIHGGFIDKEYWLNQVTYFSRSFKVVTIDLAGHGKSGDNRTDWTIESLGEDVIRVIKELSLKKVILIGHSLGGNVILEVAAKLPELVIGLIGIDNFKNAGMPLPPSLIEQVNQALELMKTNFAEVSENFARLSLVSAQTDKLVAERVLNDYKNFKPNVGRPLLISNFNYHAREKELLQNLKLKLHLINVDYFPTNEELLKQNTGSGYELNEMKGTCHYPMIEYPDKFNAVLEKVVSAIMSS
jgi:pimeloyl-ACP methyl ester carboxylesterase